MPAQKRRRVERVDEEGPSLIKTTHKPDKIEESPRSCSTVIEEAIGQDEGARPGDPPKTFKQLVR